MKGTITEEPHLKKFPDAGGAMARRRRRSRSLLFSLSKASSSFVILFLLLVCSVSGVTPRSEPLLAHRWELIGTETFTGDSWFVFCSFSSAHHHVLTGFSAFGLRSTRLNRLLPLRVIPRLEGPLPKTPPTSSQVHFPATCFNVITTDARGTPHITRSIDPDPFRQGNLYSPRSSDISTITGLTREPGDSFTFGEVSPQFTCTLPFYTALKTPELRSEPLPYSSGAFSTICRRWFSQSRSVIGRRRRPLILEMGLTCFILGLANPLNPKGPHLWLIGAFN
ncbi:hypothetical protein Bca52824_022103 [Brassica carinata]|uniref:Uncharacterized protein n=1 Tax=Brassica carinata TaxID=52824 RepID=A0A8X7VFX0_BRACI|nr:hypothetical protein Bca52824_022103 [Brassica carinata]